MKRIPYATGEFSLASFEETKYEAITVEWVRAFIIELGLPIELRPYQERIVTKTVNHFLVDGLKCILVESATGSGKTVMGLTICLILQYRTGAKTSWTTLRRELLRQAHKTNNDLFKNPENHEQELGQVLLKTISMMGKNPEGNDILVVDEAHKDATTSMAHVHECVNARFIVLLSATPIRADKATIFYDKIIKDSGIRALIRDRWLAEFNLWTIDVWTPEQVAECYLRSPEKWGKSAVFFHKFEQCEEFAKILKENGVHCEVVTGKSDRDEQLQRFEAGEVDVLVNMMVLTEGFDCPSLETVFVRDSYKGTTVQMAGRVLRLWDNVANRSPRQGNENTIIKNIVQSKNTSYPFCREANAVGKYVWDTEIEDWKELVAKNGIIAELRQATMTKMIAHAMQAQSCDTKLDELIRRRAGKKRRAPRGRGGVRLTNLG